ncbi:MAG: hypothetical protein PHV82_14655 [Victivallaceae bacterium]|nr:hypothetical protein [Victivallaceae bacterium]
MNGKDTAKKNHIRNIFIAALAYSLGITGFCLLYQPVLPEVKKMEPAELLEFVASDRFAGLPVEKQKKYTSNLRLGPGNSGSQQILRNASPETREAVFRNMRKVMQQEMRERVKKFFQMSKEEQDKFIGQMAAEMKNRRPPPETGNNRSGNNNRNSGNGKPPRGNPQAMFENTDSTTRAQMHEMHERIRAGMEQTGKQ